MLGAPFGECSFEPSLVIGRCASVRLISTQQWALLLQPEDYMTFDGP